MWLSWLLYALSGPGPRRSKQVIPTEKVRAMQAALDAQAAQLRAIGGAEAVEDVMEDLRETMEEQQEISEVLSTGFTEATFS